MPCSLIQQVIELKIISSIDDRETELLRANHVIDPHIKPRPEKVKLLGYEICPVECLEYSPDFFVNHQLREVEEADRLVIAGSTMKIDDQLRWLKEELDIVQEQREACVEHLTEKIEEQQERERCEEEERKGRKGLLASILGEALINLEMR